MKMAYVLENDLESALLALIFTLNSVGCTQIYFYNKFICKAHVMRG